MAVSSTVTLPAQPTAGTVHLVPLGGNGFTAPHSAYVVQNHQVTGAAGGGAATLVVNMDPRYCSLVSYVTLRDDQVSSADADQRFIITSPVTPAQIPQLVDHGLTVAISATVNQTTIAKTWAPTPTILPGAGQAGVLQGVMLNVADDEYFLSCLIYLFNIRVRETTPLGPILWARGAT